MFYYWLHFLQLLFELVFFKKTTDFMFSVVSKINIIISFVGVLQWDYYGVCEMLEFDLASKMVVCLRREVRFVLGVELRRGELAGSDRWTACYVACSLSSVRRLQWLPTLLLLPLLQLLLPLSQLACLPWAGTWAAACPGDSLDWRQWLGPAHTSCIGKNKRQ